MPVPIKITDHSQVGLDLLLGQFQEKPIIEGVLTTWMDKIQEVENDLYDLMTQTLFLNAEGENLQRYGTLLGIPRPDGISDGVYRELLIAEILRRSSDGTPDRIRQIIEATTGMSGMRVFEHYNANEAIPVLGSIMIYGYADPSIVTFKIDADEGKFLKRAAPTTTGSVILGQHLYGESSLFIPSELVASPERLYINQTGDSDPNSTDFLVTDTDDFIAIQQSIFDQYGEGFENGVLPEFGVGTAQFNVENIPLGEDEFGINTLSSEESFQVDTIGTIDSSKGITLEISQNILTEDAN